MKKLIFYLTVILFFSLYGCQNNEMTEDVTLSNSSDTRGYELSDDEISQLLQSYFQQLQKKEPETRGMQFPHIKKIKKEYYAHKINTRGSGSEEPEFTICNIDLQCEDDEGFAIVLADKRLPLVLAYSPHGNYANLKKSQNEALINYVENIPINIKNILSEPEYIRPEYLNAENKYATFPFDMKNDAIYATTDIKGASHDVAYLLENIHWKQDAPYNRYFPINTTTNENQLVGCVAIALTNIMAYYKYPHQYNWEIMTMFSHVPDYEPAADTIGIFLKEVADTLHTQYQDSISTARPYDCYRALTHYGYIYNTIIPYNLDTIGASVKNKCPVIAFGEDKTGRMKHAFVIRGYWKIIVTEEMKKEEKYLYDDGVSLGVAWGNEYGFGDGWYLVKWGKLDIGGLGLGKYDPWTGGIGPSYHYNLNVITNIKPKN